MAVCELRTTLPWIVPASPGPASVNTLYVDFGVTPITSGTLADVLDATEALYSTRLAGLWSSLLSGEVLISAKDLSQPSTDPPVAEREGTLIPSGDGSVAPEASILVSFRADYESGVSKRKFRGRNFVGPLALTLANWSLDGHISTTAIQQVADAYADWSVDVATGGTLKWCCGSVAEGFKDVSRIEVPNEVSMLRSRQHAVTAAEVRVL